MSNERRFGLNQKVEAQLQDVLKSFHIWGQWRELALAITELSNHFIQQSGPTPWETERLQAAYLGYFLPLNFARLAAVFHEASQLGFQWQTPVIDIGSGPGTAHLAALSLLPHSALWKSWEVSTHAIDLHQKILGQKNSDNVEWLQKQPSFKKSTVIASYALNEWPNWPQTLLEAEQIIIVEPSTQMAGRRLMEFRQKLIDQGFHIWAPCTHQQLCPLLTESKRDWCHDRIYFNPPEWWTELETHLPMRNQTLTFSYLIASRAKPKQQTSQQKARVIGDTLYEKGKTRQAVCRGPHREFLSWLRRDGEAVQLQHGQLIELPLDIEKKGNELRLKP